MTFKYEYDIASAVILFILLVYNCCIPQVKNLVTKLFKYFLLIGFISSFADSICGVFISVHFSDNLFLSYLCIWINFASTHLIAPLYLMFVMALTNKYEKIPYREYLYFIPAGVAQILIFFSPVTGWVYTYSAENGYHRGKMLPLLICISLFYMIYGSILVWFKGKHLGLYYQLTVMGLFVISAVFLGIQIYYGEYVLLDAAMGISAFIMQLTLLNPKMIRDASEKEIVARKAAEAASAAKSSFLANMSHELRTPLNAIYGMTELLEKSKLDDFQEDSVTTIRHASEKLISIVDDLLNYSKIDSGNLDINETEYKFSDLLERAETYMAEQLDERNIDFEVNVGAGIPSKLYGDYEKVYTILKNILSNASKFTEKGKIILDISFNIFAENNMKLIFKVRDTGIGIKPTDMKKLFKSFSQVDDKTNRKIQGTGIGLALSKQLANLMNGDIEVHSEYGFGSCFEISVIQKYLELEKLPSEREVVNYKVYLYTEEYDLKWHISKIFSRLGISVIFVHNIKQLEKIPLKKINNMKTILLYSYEKSKKEVESLNLPFRTIAIAEYNTVIPKDDQNNVLVKPIDIIKIRRIVFDRMYDIVFKERLAKGKDNQFDLSNAHIALVDDNKVNLRIEAALLKDFNVKIEAFTSGSAILKAYSLGRRYDIIFMDHMMPEVDGIETAKRIRNLPENAGRTVKIIALTANVIQGVENEYIAAGMDDWLFKPVKQEQLKGMILKHLRT